jgi:hypothetical protein
MPSSPLSPPRCAASRGGQQARCFLAENRRRNMPARSHSERVDIRGRCGRAGRVLHSRPTVVLLAHHAIIDHAALTGLRSRAAVRLCERAGLLLEACHRTERLL